MILIDSSVVIEFTRSGDPALLKQFFIHNGAITGITRAEVLHSARNPKHLGTITKKCGKLFHTF